MNIDKYYQKGRYDHIKNTDKSELAQFYRKRFKAISKALQDYEFKKVLDAGCGDGEIGKMLQIERRVNVHGVDISRKGVDLANKKGLHAKVADISVHIPFRSNTFDLVISSETIEHVLNPDIFLKEIYRVLKPGGIILITTPNLSSWLNRLIMLIGLYPLFLEASTEVKVGYGKFIKYFYGLQLVGHIHVFNVPALQELLIHHHFSVDKISGNTVDFVSPKSRFITGIYSYVDRFMTHIPSLCSDMIIVAKK